MPIPKPQIHEIGARPTTAVTIDQNLISCRNVEDDSYGRYCQIDGKALITAATLQAFIEQGVPMDSDRLEGSYRWLLKNLPLCTSVNPALLRANVAIATGNRDYEDIETDISSLKSLVKDLSINESGKDHIPGFLLALECLNNLNEIDESIKKIVLDKIAVLLHSSLASPAELAYALQIAIDLEIVNEETISDTLASIMNRFDRATKLWRSCYAETAYVIIDLSYIAIKRNLPEEIKESLTSATNQLIRSYYDSYGLPRVINKPDEIGNSEYDVRIYLNALILRAIVRSSVFFSEAATFSLKFAHAYLQKVYQEHDSLITLMRRKIFMSRVSFPIVSIASLVFGIFITRGITIKWSAVNQSISVVSGFVTIGTCIYNIRKYKKN